MLVDFTVENYRSIKEAVTLSAVAQKSTASRRTTQSSKRKGIKSDAEVTPGHHLQGWDIDILPVLTIFGANASGKSNVIQALDYLLMLMAYGNQGNLQLQQVFKYAKFTPFKLDNIYAKKPTRFELRVAMDEAIYTYSLVLNQSHIISERLDYTLLETKRTRRLFERDWDKNINKFIWKNGSDFTGSHTKLQGNIRKDELFISLISRLDIDVVIELCSWLRIRLPGISLGMEKTDMLFIANELNDGDPTQIEIREQIIEIIKKFDTGLAYIDIQTQIEYPDEYEIYAVHHTSDGNEIRWSFDEESLGTQRLLSLAYRMLFTLQGGGLTIVDELGTNIHPNIVSTIIKMFQNPQTNPNGAQLIFTSHDNTLQRNNLLRRDQIWFTQKRPDHSTELYPLTDFHVRNDLAIDKAYLDGRFGAVPFLPSNEEMILKGD